MYLTASERETIVSMDDAEGVAHIYTAMQTWKNRMAKLAAANPDDVRLVRSDDVGVEYEVPKTWVRISRPVRINLTDEQRAANIARLKAAREAKAAQANRENS